MGLQIQGSRTRPSTKCCPSSVPKRKELFSLTEPSSSRTPPRRPEILTLALFTVLGIALLVLGSEHLRCMPWCIFKTFWNHLTIADLPGVEEVCLPFSHLCRVASCRALKDAKHFVSFKTGVLWLLVFFRDQPKHFAVSFSPLVKKGQTYVKRVFKGWLSGVQSTCNEKKNPHSELQLQSAVKSNSNSTI